MFGDFGFGFGESTHVEDNTSGTSSNTRASKAPRASFGSSRDDGERIRRVTRCAPVTVNLVSRYAGDQSGQPEFKICGVETRYVDIVGFVENVSCDAGSFEATLTDSTGSLTVKKFFESSTETPAEPNPADIVAQQKDEIRRVCSSLQSGACVRVVGMVRTGKDWYVSALSIQVVTSANELVHHFISAMSSYFDISGGSGAHTSSSYVVDHEPRIESMTTPVKQFGNSDSLSTSGNSENIRESNSDAVRNAVIDVIKKLGSNPMGAERNQIIARLTPRFSQSQVLESIAQLTSDCLIYDVDASHYKYVE